MKKGVFYGVSVGPGDPELITVKALKTLEKCLVIAYPVTGGEAGKDPGSHPGSRLAWSIASRAADLTGKIELPLAFSMGKNPGQREAEYAAAAGKVETALAAGEDVAMLNLGDVSIYASYSHLAEILSRHGYETAAVPGVPSFCASSAALGVSLTEGDFPVHIFSGRENTEEALTLPGTKVFMKTGRKLPELTDTLGARGKLSGSMAVKNCGLPGEDIYPDLSERAPEPDAGYFVTVIVKE